MCRRLCQTNRWVCDVGAVVQTTMVSAMSLTSGSQKRSATGGAFHWSTVDAFELYGVVVKEMDKSFGTDWDMSRGFGDAALMEEVGEGGRRNGRLLALN